MENNEQNNELNNETNSEVSIETNSGTADVANIEANSELDNEPEEVLGAEETSSSENNENNIQNENSASQKLMTNTMTSDWRELSKNSNFKPKKRGLKILITIVVVLLALVGAGFAYLKFLKPDAQKVYGQMLQKYSSEIVKVLDANTNAGSFVQEGNVSIKTDMDDYSILNGISLDYSMGLDSNSKIMNANIIYKEQDKSILNADVYMQDNKIYLKSDQIYNGLLYIDEAEDDDLNMYMSPEDVKKVDDLLEKGTKHLQKALAKATYKTERDTLSINDRKTFVQKNIMIIDKTNVNNIKNELLTSIKNDNEFLNTLKNISNEDINEIKAEIDEMIRTDASKEMEPIEMEIDTSLLTNKVLAIKLMENNESVLNAVSSGNNKYDISFAKDLKGTLTVNNSNNVNFETKIEDYKLFMEMVTTDNKDSYNLSIKVTDPNNKYIDISMKSNTTNKNIEKVSVDKAVDMSKLSAAEQEKISANLENVFKSSTIFGSFMQDYSME